MLLFFLILIYLFIGFQNTINQGRSIVEEDLGITKVFLSSWAILARTRLPRTIIVMGSCQKSGYKVNGFPFNILWKQISSLKL
jgi:hypothetical protein